MSHKAKHFKTEKTEHGVVIHVRCCEGESARESTHHIMRAGRYTHEELLRLRDDFVAQAQREHAEDEAAHRFLRSAEHERAQTEGCEDCK